MVGVFYANTNVLIFFFSFTKTDNVFNRLLYLTFTNWKYEKLSYIHMKIFITARSDRPNNEITIGIG